MNINNTRINYGVLFLVVSLLSSCHSSDVTGLGTATFPRFAYVANSVDSTISIYTLNATTGQLRHNGYVVTGSNPYSVNIDPSSKFAYVANFGTNDVSVYAIDAATGALTQVSCVAQPICSGGGNFMSGYGPMSVTIDPLGKFAYVANQSANTVSAYVIDATTGALTSAGLDVATGTGPTSVTVAPSGKFAYVANLISGDVSAYTIDPTSGVLTQITCSVGCNGSSNNFLAGNGSYSVTVDPKGKFAYVANANNSNVSAYTINAVTGVLSAVTGSPFTTPSGPRSVTTDPYGAFAYVANGSGVLAYRIDASTGALFPVGLGLPVAAGSLPNSVTVDPSGMFAYVSNQVSNDVSVYTINAGSGALTAAGSVRARAGSSSVAMTKGTAAVTYKPKFAYVANQNGDSVSAYTIDAMTGALNSVVGSPFTTGISPYSVTVAPSGKFAFVAATSALGIWAQTIDAATGALATVAGSPFKAGAGTGPISVSVDSSSRFVYVANNNSSNVSAYTISATTGVLTTVPGSPFTAGTNPYSVITDPSGRFAYTANFGSNDVSAYTVNPGGGVLTQVACTGGVAVCNGNNFIAGTQPISVTADPTGKFVYVANNGGSVSAYSIDAVTGSLTAIGSPIAVPSNPHFVTVDPLGKFVYVAKLNTPDVSIFTIDATTGALSGSLTGLAGSMPTSVAVDPTGKFAYVTNGGTDNVLTYTLDATTGGLTHVGTSVVTGAFPQTITTTGTIQ